MKNTRTAVIWVLGIAVMLFVMFNVLLSIKTLQAVTARNCSQFGTREIAQRAFDREAGNKSVPNRYAWADRDRDGRACERLPLTVPTQ